MFPLRTKLLAVLQLVQTDVELQTRQPVRDEQELQPEPLGVKPLEQVKQLVVTLQVRQ